MDNCSQRSKSLMDEDCPESKKKSSEQQQLWRSEKQIAVLIDNIPKHWMIADLKAFVDDFGSVVKAEIFEDRLVYIHRDISNCRREKAMVEERFFSGAVPQN